MLGLLIGTVHLLVILNATVRSVAGKWVFGGVAGAAVCGGEIWLIRRMPVLGLEVGPLAAGIAGCLLAALDATH